MKTEAVRKIYFCAGHRVYGHESKCSNLHGHNYVLWVYATASELDHLGRVIDFSILKEKIDSWIQLHWDHTFLAFEKDAELRALEPLIQKNKPWFICPFNPTAENMATYLIKEIIPELLKGTGVSVTRLTLYETENCMVEVNSSN